MDWRGLLDGFEALREPSLGLLLPVLLIVAGAYAAGYAIGRQVGRPLALWLNRRSIRPHSAAHVPEILNYGTASIILVVAAGLASPQPLALLILAAALGGGVTFLTRNVARTIGFGLIPSLLFGLIAGTAAAAGTLGGLEPLAAALEKAGFGIGKRRVSVLGAIELVVLAGVIFGIARILDRLLRHSIARARGLDPSQRVLADKLASLGVVVAAFLVGVDVLGIDLTALAFFSGATGLAIGFGLQKTFGNLISGLILLMDRSIKPGDVIVVADTFGWVNKIGVRAVSVLTRDGKEHLIPNELLMTERVENWSYTDRNVRIRIPVGVAFDCDLDLAQRLMLEAAIACPRALKSPKPTVWLTGFGEYAITHDILLWIDDPEAGIGNVQSDVLNRLWRMFKEQGVTVPYPRRDVHFPEFDAAPPPNRAAPDDPGRPLARR